MFNLQELKKGIKRNNRYEKRLSVLEEAGQDVSRIKSVVENAMLNIEKKQNSFVIYGEPQSGKTEMMIALTAKLLDEQHKIVIVLLNDSVQLLGQNLERFQRSGLSPTPKKFKEILSKEVKIGDQQWVIFCKKNSQDLKKLVEKLKGHSLRVILDDEADYATPNSKVNKNEKSKINALTATLIGPTGIYIGVTATPARLDLNRTHKNQNEHWIDFPVHSYYSGQDVFFPFKIENLLFRLTFLPSTADHPKQLRQALFNFMVNVAYLNTQVNKKHENYSFLIHTSGKKTDHSDDYKRIQKVLGSLTNESDTKHQSYYSQIWKIAKERYKGHETRIAEYIIGASDCNNLVVMNSDKEVNAADNRIATEPTAPFTIIIGGNIVSRGVTFNNLISMFFTRDVVHKLQQDTYIQRARMFGSREKYLKYFELTIPQALYLDWQKCFIFHRLSLQSRKQDKKSPIWLDGAERVRITGGASIDRANVVVREGEMSFGLFDFNSTQIEQIILKQTSELSKIKQLAEMLGKDCLPAYLISYIEAFLPAGDKCIAVHMPKSIAGYKDIPGATDRETIMRTRGFIGKNELEQSKYPSAIHHIKILYNGDGKARVFYKYRGDVRFLKIKKPYSKNLIL